MISQKALFVKAVSPFSRKCVDPPLGRKSSPADQKTALEETAEIIILPQICRLFLHIRETSRRLSAIIKVKHYIHKEYAYAVY